MNDVVAFELTYLVGAVATFLLLWRLGGMAPARSLVLSLIWPVAVIGLMIAGVAAFLGAGMAALHEADRRSRSRSRRRRRFSYSGDAGWFGDSGWHGPGDGGEGHSCDSGGHGG